MRSGRRRDRVVRRHVARRSASSAREQQPAPRRDAPVLRRCRPSRGNRRVGRLEGGRGERRAAVDSGDCDLFADILDLDLRAQHEPAQALDGGRGDIARQDPRMPLECGSRCKMASTRPLRRRIRGENRCSARQRGGIVRHLPLQKSDASGPRSAAPPCAAKRPRAARGGPALRLPRLSPAMGHDAINGAVGCRCQPRQHSDRGHCGYPPFQIGFLQTITC